MKAYIRTLWNDDYPALWDNEEQKSALRNHLNDLGFYTLNGVGDTLDVFAISFEKPWDIRVLEKVLDKWRNAIILIKGEYKNGSRF